VEEIIKIVDSGGVLALAILVWYELRAFRVAVVSTLSNISTKQALILQRQTETYVCPYTAKRRLELNADGPNGA